MTGQRDAMQAQVPVILTAHSWAHVCASLIAHANLIAQTSTDEGAPAAAAGLLELVELIGHQVAATID